MMGRIAASIDVQNVTGPRVSRKLDALVDTGASYVTLPLAWKEQFGAFETEETIELQTANQQTIGGTICGPVKIRIEGFRAIYNEVLFIDMESGNGGYEPLLGYIVLEQCGAAVDLVGHRLVPVRYMDAKSLPWTPWSSLPGSGADGMKGRIRLADGHVRNGGMR